MSLQSIADLAAFAVANNFARGNSKVPTYELSLEEARKAVRVKDGNKRPKEDGTQALVLVLGKKTLKLDVIAANATRVNATAEQVEQFTAMLEGAVEAGQFDAAILEAQKELKTAKEEREAKPVVAVEEAPAVEMAEVQVEAAPEGVDLDTLD